MSTKPTLFIDENKCKENIRRMFSKAERHHLVFRPHFKTHQSLEVGIWFKEIGVDKITVSSLTMASYFSTEWDDITVAFPVNLLEIDTVNDLAEKITINLLVENEESIIFLSDKLKYDINVFLKIDVGYHRTGLDPDNVDLIDQILGRIQTEPKIKFKGFLAHAGHSYECREKEDVNQIHAASLSIMNELKAKYIKQYPTLVTSLGDTPTCSISEDFTGLDEIRPGNFIFYDLTQNLIGSNSISEISVAMACPIVAVHKNRSEIVIYGGGVHFSKERLEDQEDVIYGRVVEKLENSWGEIIPDMFIKSLSQEHGIVSVPKDLIDKYKVGDVLMVLPIHSCMTANLMRSYTSLSGKTISRLY